MNKFVVAIFPDLAKAREGALLLRDRCSKDSRDLQALAVVAKDSNEKLSVREIIHEHPSGTAVGAFIGALAGFPAGGPIAGAVGATAGALFGLSADLINRGASKTLLEKVSRELLPGKAAIIGEVSEEWMTTFEEQTASIGGTILHEA